MRYSLYQQMVSKRFYTSEHAHYIVGEWANTPAAQYLIQRGEDIWWRTVDVNTSVRIQVLGELDPRIHTLYLMRI